MAVYRFRVSFEEYDDVYRDIEIKSTQTFAQLHTAIQEAINFDASKPASFYMSNDLWKKGQEIAMPEIAEASNGSKLSMDKSRMCDFIADPHQKIYYVFDQPSQWTFYIELIKILPEDSDKKYPVCVKVHGEGPKQYIKIEAPKGMPDPELSEDSMFEDILMEESDSESDSDDENDNDSSDFSEEVDEDEYDNIEESEEDDQENM